MINKGNELKLQLVNPGILERYIKTMSPWFCGAFVSSLIIGLWFAIFNSPPDYLQGETVRIMYVHVPSAWISLFCFAAISFFCILNFLFKLKNVTLIYKSLAPIGLTFNIVAIVTGSLWGQPTWGTWWAWDARLTSMLVLMFFYIAFIFSYKFIIHKHVCMSFGCLK